MNKILFVVNPISGGIDKSDLKTELKSCCTESNVAFDLIETKGEDDHRLISEEIEKSKPDAVVACGGDGTINLVAQVLLGKGISLGIIPLGSANGLATELLIPKNIRKAVKIIIKNHVIDMDVLRINGKFLSLHLSDVGFNAKLIKNFDEGGSRGKLAYAAHFFKVLFKKAPSKYTFIMGENSFRRRAEMVVFANASKYGTGAVVNPDGCLYDKKFEVCIFKPYPWYAIFRLAFDFFTGRMKQSPYVKIFSTTNIVVRSKKKVPLQVDGEVMGDFKQVKVTLEDVPLPIIVPPGFK
ncbi:diacylglycerol kinase family lipid kinase [Fulvivirga ulvae]|uniref:diacylglycerol/lipid kinase family protein n=1 Tax=Fulvivirga ulvae TaxID=2904245 RepID=UPI001F1C24D6|nr:diacylglycerol kinase family protein [Fulvivirga ulvae]UII33898.1 diacylglycerol kinase family lipid kinase [Fulvivirga ulvae]